MTLPNIAEQRLADDLGVARGLLSAARKKGGPLLEGPHWFRDEANGGRVTYLAAGIAAVRGFLGLPAAEKKEGGGAPDGGLVELTVTRHTRNPRILEASTPEGRPVRVRIKAGTQGQYQPKGRLFGRPVGPLGDGLFALEPGRRPLAAKH